MQIRPTGTVTFLFTDIEGSTRRWEAHPALMPAAFARQEALLRAAITAAGGWAYKQIGDAFQAAFSTAPAALAAAVAAQRALAAEPWPAAIGPVRVRMALHTGTTEERADDYVGPLLNRAARLLAAAHGGQILLTATTCEAIQGQVPGGVELRDLGERRLKDLIRPEHVFQVAIAGLPAEFPPLKTLDVHPNNLPRQTTALIGRESEMTAVTTLLRRPEVALVTLTGPGGTGKTRLALQTAAHLLDEFPAGVWFVDLAPLTDVTLVPSAIAAALHVREAGPQPLLATLQDYLRDKQLLLVLDNFEQVVAGAGVISALLKAGPQVKVLVTSRAPLHLYGEHEFPVPPLALPDLLHLPPLDRLTQYEAVRLFVERAQAAKPDFRVTAATARAVAEICVHLDGLPLAIELAAARSRIFTPEALRARMTGRLQLLVGGARDLPARQQTLRNALAWSYELLPLAEQRLFQRLAVFVDGCTVPAAEAICNPAGDLGREVLDGLAALLDHSLLQVRESAAGEPRFTMLETIREFAWTQLAASGTAAQLQQQHLVYYLDQAEAAAPQLRGPTQGQGLALLTAEVGNLRAALDWAAQQPTSDWSLRLVSALWRFWRLAGHFGEGRQRIMAALAQAGTGTPAARAMAHCGLGVLTLQMGDFQGAAPLLQTALALFRQIEDQAGAGYVLSRLGDCACRAGDYAVARAYCEESLTGARRSGDPWAIADALQGLAAAAQGLGDTEGWRAANAASLTLFRELGDGQSTARALINLAVAAIDAGDFAAARPLLEESLGIHESMGTRPGIAVAQLNLGVVMSALGDTAAAGRLYAASLAIFRELGSTPGIAAALHGLGQVARRAGEATTAARVLGESLRLCAAIGYPKGIGACLVEFAALATGGNATESRARRAACLLGAAQRQFAASGGIDAAAQAVFAPVQAVAQETLNPAGWTMAYAAGQAMATDEVVAYALEEGSHE